MAGKAKNKRLSTSNSWLGCVDRKVTRSQGDQFDEASTIGDPQIGGDSLSERGRCRVDQSGLVSR